MLLPKSKSNCLWSINTTSKHKKSFSFLKEPGPTVFPLLHAWWGLLSLLGRQRCSAWGRAPVLLLMRKYTLESPLFHLPNRVSSRIALSSTCAKFDVGLILSCSPFPQT